MSGRLDAVVGGTRPPGVYRWRSRAHSGAVRRELAAAGWTLHLLDGRTVTGAVDLFDRLADELAFPAWFGRNFDALADCLGDLSWLPGVGHVLVWDQWGVMATADAKAWRQAYQTFQVAIEARAHARLVPLYVLLRGTGPALDPDTGEPIPVL
jgi:RNAse (barnase) inhibitor barstar